MHVLQIKAEQTVVVHRRRMLFQFQLAPADNGGTNVYFQMPVREADGTPLPVLTCRIETLQIGDVLESGYEGMEQGERVQGDFQIELAAYDGALFSIRVTLPTDWGLERQPLDDEG